MAVSIFAPIGYIVFLVGSLVIFSRVYRRRKAAQPSYEPWFPQHLERDIYISLLSHDPPPSQTVLVASLLRRAVTDVKRIWSIRDSKPALQTLLQKGQIGDDLWNRFLSAEKEMEAEVMEVVEEANTFKDGWGQQIFAVASDMVNHEKFKGIYSDISEERKKEAAKNKSLATAQLLSQPSSLKPPDSSQPHSRPVSRTSAYPTPPPDGLTPPVNSVPLPGEPQTPNSVAKSETGADGVKASADEDDGGEEDNDGDSPSKTGEGSTTPGKTSTSKSKSKSKKAKKKK